MSSERHYQWRERFKSVTDKAQTTPFIWGENDCCTFVLECIEAVINKPPAYFGYDVLLGSYNSPEQAIFAIRSNKAAGAKNLVELVERKLKEIHPSQAHIGDIAVMETNEGFTGYALGIFIGERVMFLHKDGAGTIDRSGVQRAFSVESA